ncbi:hypothetical protein DL98DRAFT_454426 [Cadophora sp. DSE1049]|nr:hypothetical protein DL98DRAFT_454426 [Cadophora sp. DSE1049]
MPKRSEWTVHPFSLLICKWLILATRHITPGVNYPPKIVNELGKDIAQSSQGIYYYDSFHPTRVPDNRNVFVPSIEGVNWEGSEEDGRRERALAVERHMINNETFHKSEYAWEADAWADIFGHIRDDNQLVIDKRDCNIILAKTDAITCLLTGESTSTKRIPDATFGLSTYVSTQCEDHYTPCDYRHCPYRFPNWNATLQRDKLERLALHPKCGLLADPKWGENDMAFPFMVYEAKGWSGDYREARRQACLAAKTYLDMLDELCRVPGGVGSAGDFQTDTSHDNQVFALTSYGAHWHLLLAFKKPREKDQHANTEGLSRNVYIFQKIWSGRVINERSAWELLCLIDQIHQYATTRFRDYVIQHLQPWHSHCDQNFLLDWQSHYSVSWHLRGKRKRAVVVGDLPLPNWCQHLSNEAKEKLQGRAKAALVEAMEKEELKKVDEERRKRLRRDKGYNEEVLSVKTVPVTFFPPAGNGKGKEKVTWSWK